MTQYAWISGNGHRWMIPVDHIELNMIRETCDEPVVHLSGQSVTINVDINNDPDRLMAALGFQEARDNMEPRKAAIVSTTINVMPNLPEWVSCMRPDDVMIIAGDLRSPHAAIRELISTVTRVYKRTVVYLTPDKQTGWRSSEAIGWNVIQRRNIAILEAMTYKPDFIVTIDDDNYPSTQDMLFEIENELFEPSPYALISATKWWNPGSLCVPPVTHRGYPMSQRHKIADTSFLDNNTHHIGVFASLWLGDPDIDAIERIAVDPIVTDIGGAMTLATLTWAPFNSQATAFRTPLAPLMYCIPNIGRMDDIWGSYIARAIMDHVGAHVTYGAPAVRQDRNQHNLIRDLENEMIGYRHTEEFCEFLRAVQLPDTRDVVELYAHVCTELFDRDFTFMRESLAPMSTWVNDLIELSNDYNTTFVWEPTEEISQ